MLWPARQALSAVTRGDGKSATGPHATPLRVLMPNERTSERRRTLELHEGLVQSLVVAKLMLELGDSERAVGGVTRALQLAKEVVHQSLEELREAGHSPEQLIRAAASADG